ADEGTGGPDAKYADTGVATLVDALTDRGADPSGLRAKFAGGSDMLDVGGDGIGDRNVAATRAALDARDIPVVATDVGGDSGRTLVFRPGAGRLVVRGADGTERL
ncbi:MAG: chemotaxis protein CheD, partial [Haloferacaceae archaeon]